MSRLRKLRAHNADLPPALPRGPGRPSDAHRREGLPDRDRRRGAAGGGGRGLGDRPAAGADGLPERRLAVIAAIAAQVPPPVSRLLVTPATEPGAVRAQAPQLRLVQSLQAHDPAVVATAQRLAPRVHALLLEAGPPPGERPADAGTAPAPQAWAIAGGGSLPPPRRRRAEPRAEIFARRPGAHFAIRPRGFGADPPPPPSKIRGDIRNLGGRNRAAAKTAAGLGRKSCPGARALR
ncbi:hypothetical protein [Teichococcus deserti]|uniref:hypothetical protein n=1 Tax=Teichococcus deserti TaxID=1817963 RepID=UPI001054B29F|nr:hypothetical protein [Pseudoroseomonas deserti]